jgi:hypothetical protein
MPAEPDVTYTELRTELLRRREVDQVPMREARVGKPISRAAIEQMRATARENAEWLKGVISEHGWPGRSLVGENGSDAAWLLVQHADHLPAGVSQPPRGGGRPG